MNSKKLMVGFSPGTGKLFRVKSVLFQILLLLVCGTQSFGQVGVLPKKDTALKQITDRKFRIGDVWEYITRLGEESSRLTIVRIDKSPELGVIIHVGVDNIKLTNCRGGPEPNSIPHMPFARSALDASVRKRVATNHPLPSFEGGYEDWRSAYVRKSAGIYIISVADAVSVAEKTFQQGIACDTADRTPTSILHIPSRVQ